MAEYISDAEVLQRALDTYGSTLQIVVMMEEMSELQKELCKYLRGKYSPENIAEEIADVEIMLEQMKMLFCCADDVHDVRRRKVERLKERLDNGDHEYPQCLGGRQSGRRRLKRPGRCARQQHPETRAAGRGAALDREPGAPRGSCLESDL